MSPVELIWSDRRNRFNIIMGVVRELIQRITMTEVSSLGIALALCTLGQVTAARGMHGHSTCNVDSRPHREGICGDTLLRARANLCFLITEDYPEIFGHGKRSVRDVFDLSLEALAKMHPYGDELEATSPPLAPKNKFAFLPLLMSKAQSAAGTVEPPRNPLPAYKRDGWGEITTVQKRGLVCDCCYNKCLPSILARYC